MVEKIPNQTVPINWQKIMSSKLIQFRVTVLILHFNGIISFILKKLYNKL